MNASPRHRRKSSPSAPAAKQNTTRPAPEALAGRTLATLKKACTPSGSGEQLVWWCETFILRSPKSREKVGEAILSARPEPHVLALALNTAAQRIADRGFAAKPGAAAAISALVSKAQLGADRGSLPLSDEFLRLPFKSEQLKVLLACFAEAAVAPSKSDMSVSENAWSLADESLARALQQTPRLRAAIEPTGGLDRELRRYIGETIDALRHASRTREMEIVGQLGDVIAFDTLLHAEDDQGFRSGDPVKIVRPAVVQGDGAYRRVVRKAQVLGAG